MTSDNKASLVSPTRICLLLRKKLCSGITVHHMHQYLGSNYWCETSNGSNQTSPAMLFVKDNSFHASIHGLQYVISVDYIVQRVWLQRLMCVRLVSKPKSWSPVQVSKVIEQIDGGVCRKKSWRVITLSVGTVCQPTITSQRFLVNFTIPMGENNKATCVLHYLLIMQVGKFSTSINSLPKHLKHFKINSVWKHLLVTKVSPSNNIIRTMVFLPQEIPRRIVMNKSNCKHLAVLVHNTRMALPSKTSRRLHVGQEQVCWVVLFIGLHMSKWSCGIWLLIMLSRYSIDCLS